MITFDPSLVCPWVAEKSGSKFNLSECSAIGRVKDNELIAGVYYDNWNGANVFAHIRGSKGWATKRFIWMMFDYPFNQLGAKRITASIKSHNKDAILFVTRLGFRLECVLEQAIPDGDIHFYRMFKHECRFI